MTEIIPAVLAKNFENLRENVARYATLSSTIQIDVCDGRFVPTTTWPMNPHDRGSVEAILSEEEGLPYWDSLDFEFDLMIRNAHEQFEFFVRLGARRIIFHIEAEYDKTAFKDFLDGLDMYTRDTIQIGLAINTTTPISELEKFIHSVDFIQCMGIEHIGHQGEPFDVRVLNQITSLRELYPELIISIDGSVNEDTAPLLVSAGANRLVVGSALARSFDIRQTVRELESL